VPKPKCLVDAIAANRKREERRDKAERLLRRIRLRVFDYEDQGKYDKAARIMEKLKAILRPRWEAHAEARRKAKTDAMMRTWE
jgi:hypothetical protein